MTWTALRPEQSGDPNKTPKMQPPQVSAVTATSDGHSAGEGHSASQGRSTRSRDAVRACPLQGPLQGLAASVAGGVAGLLGALDRSSSVQNSHTMSRDAALSVAVSGLSPACSPAVLSTGEQST